MTDSSSSIVVVTGAEAAAEPVRTALEAAGAEVVVASSGADVAARLDGRPVTAYVQLPTVLSIEGRGNEGSVVERIGRFLSNGLLARFQDAASVLPHLGEQSRVVLVAGNTPVPGTGVDDQAARLSLLRVLAHALRAEEAPQRLRVRVLEHDSGSDLVAKTALGTDRTQGSASFSNSISTSGSGSAGTPPAGDSDVDISYADWRTEVLGLASVEF